MLGFHSGPKVDRFPWPENPVLACVWHLVLLLGGTVEWDPGGAEASMPLFLLCVAMALAVSALVDPALSQSFTAFKAQCGVCL